MLCPCLALILSEPTLPTQTQSQGTQLKDPVRSQNTSGISASRMALLGMRLTHQMRGKLRLDSAKELKLPCEIEIEIKVDIEISWGE